MNTQPSTMENDALPPRAARAFEDYRPGLVLVSGARRVDAGEMVAFARAYDPQAMHIDPVRSAAGPFGGLIASGWFTCGVMMALLVENFLPDAASLPSPGVDELRWLAPVREGDELSIRVTITGARLSKSKPDRGLVTSTVETLDGKGAVVMTMKGINLVLTRAALQVLLAR